MRFRLTRDIPDPDGAQHFIITPYRYGVALEYRGTIETWSAAFSIHNHAELYPDQGGVLWVGDNLDTGGVMVTAKTGQEEYGSVTVQKFSRQSGGDLRFVVRGAGDGFEFRAGPDGQERVGARVSAQGQIVARLGANPVEIGNAGPGGESGVRFGAGAALYLVRDGQLRTDARIDLAGGVGLGTVAPPADVDPTPTRYVPVHDLSGNPVGYIPIHGAPAFP